MVICGCLLVVCGCLLVVCGCLLVVCGRLLLFGGGFWSLPALATMGVSANNFAKIVDIVLTQIGGIQVDSIPKMCLCQGRGNRIMGGGAIPDCLRAAIMELYQYDTSL